MSSSLGERVGGQANFRFCRFFAVCEVIGVGGKQATKLSAEKAAVCVSE